jgi:hypothetical protein
MKAGTTSLHHYLIRHSQVFMARQKELDFFVAERNWHRGWQWYCSQFKVSESTVAIGEASAAYTQYPRYRGVAARIAEYLPDVRLIYIVRNPIERIRSEYQHRVLAGTEQSAIDRAVLTDPTYVDHSRYAMQMDQYLDHFERRQLLVITSESLLSDRLSTMQKVAEFLELSSRFSARELRQEFYVTAERKNLPPFLLSIRTRPLLRRAARLVPRQVKEGIMRPVRDRVPVMSDSVRQVLEERLREDVRRLSTYVGENFDAWGLA